MATTRVDIDGLPLDRQSFKWPLYRGTQPIPVILHGFGARWDEYKKLANQIKGRPVSINIYGVRDGGADGARGLVRIDGVYIHRVTRINDDVVEIECYDSRVLLTRYVGDADYNMRFGDGYLSGTAATSTLPNSYRSAIRDYVSRIPDAPVQESAFDGIPDTTLEDEVYLSALAAADPLSYLCDKAGVDLVVDKTGEWYFATRRVPTLEHFKDWDTIPWVSKPGFMTLDSIPLQRPREIKVYAWEQHTIKVEGGDPNSTVAHSGPEELIVELEQVYRYEDQYLTLQQFLRLLGFGSFFIFDDEIGESFLSDSAEGSPMHPLATAERLDFWTTVRRDWRRLWRIKYPKNSGALGGWVNWKFGRQRPDGSIDASRTVICPFVEFFRVVKADDNGKIENRPWTRNDYAITNEGSPFRAVWEEGPEQGIIRLVPEGDTNYSREPVPGSLYVPRSNGMTTTVPQAGLVLPGDSALRVLGKDEVEDIAPGSNPDGRIRNLTIFEKEDISLGRLYSKFNITIFMTATRFMPNNNTRWHREDVPGFEDGDIPYIEIPPGETILYRSFRGDTELTIGNAFPEDGLGPPFNPDRVRDSAVERARAWKLVNSQPVVGRGRAIGIKLAQQPRLVDKSIVAAEIVVDKYNTYTEVAVGQMRDPQAEDMIEARRQVGRGFQVQGKKVN